MMTKKLNYPLLILIVLVISVLLLATYKDILTYFSGFDTPRQQSCPLDSISGAAGKLFAGQKVRSLSQSTYGQLRGSDEAVISGDDGINCSKWAVLTTINGASEAVYQVVKLGTWCLVIVMDCKTPSNYDESGWIEKQKKAHVVLLDMEYQENMSSRFVREIPWNHFGRKNIGYLYAIQHGAEVIWDFDDDNIPKNSDIPPGKLNLDTEAQMGGRNRLIEVLTPRGHTHQTFNPYPHLGAPTSPSWPRGLPLKDIKDQRSFNTTLVGTKIKKASLGVLQSLANLDPDVDAIYRLTMKIPFSFKHTEETRPLLVPRRVLTPYNAQATLYFKDAFWSMLLPITVTGRVSDIWRSFFAQHLFWDCGLSLAFSAQPIVVQNRNFHDYIGDLAAEDDLYKKGEQLVKFLLEWESDAETVQGRMQELFIALYEREYIEEQDVVLVHLWLDNLKKIGYHFPKCDS